MFSSLKIKRRPIVLSFIVIAFLISLGYLANTLAALASQQIIERNQQTLNYGIKRIENHVSKIETILRAITFPPKGTHPSKDVAAELDRLSRDYPEVQNIWIANSNRRIIYATHSATIGLDLADPDSFYDMKSRKLNVISDTSSVKWTGAPLITITVPVFQGTQFCGIVGASIDLRRFNDVLQDIVQNDNNMILTVLDKDMTVLASSQGEIAAPGTKSVAFMENTPPPHWWDRLAISQLPALGEDRLFLHKTMLDGKWIIVLSQPVADVYAPWIKMFRDAIPLMALCLFLLIGLTYQLNRLENIRKMETLEFQTEKSHAVSELAASVAHEVRNPITVIRGFMQMISRRSKDPKAHEYTELVVEEIDRVESIIGEFLSLAKPHVTKKEKCDLHHILQSVYLLAQGRAIYSGISVAFNSVDTCMLMADAMQLKQVFLNFCTNAIQAMSTGGTLKISSFRNENVAIIKITDNGQGISPQSLKRLGERFFTTKESGTGLGLAVSYRIIQNHQGNITVISELGKGTEFTITLPIYLEDA